MRAVNSAAEMKLQTQQTQSRNQGRYKGRGVNTTEREENRKLGVSFTDQATDPILQRRRPFGQDSQEHIPGREISKPNVVFRIQGITPEDSEAAQAKVEMTVKSKPRSGIIGPEETNTVQTTYSFIFRAPSKDRASLKPWVPRPRRTESRPLLLSAFELCATLGITAVSFLELLTCNIVKWRRGILAQSPVLCHPRDAILLEASLFAQEHDVLPGRCLFTVLRNRVTPRFFIPLVHLKTALARA
ncbi:hypothetical protein C8F04DRAFT_1181004 [Mycena alexandri]|uniref:Uncharacterized protein n=1 Tax=Mycena alexandri TaxID=1745969 RepID=A0AAD6T066_9AGAR|nr:hypothetical protein C8F04DRAFT_1181004 [Mycena alexandri]